MAGTILASEIGSGTKIRLRTGELATVLDNRKRSVSRTISFRGPFGPCRGDDYIFNWSCLEDGTRITFDEKHAKKRAAIRACGLL